ncbi:putative reverse transcriptase domain-containing protein [Tanacetum coccineum]|uniref:Reverse transcriptase domain-containing protein n=1 Tax=Tanacetum coccineum TaxID=301880 RepID=A0ABQ5ILN1_9ASTR
MEAKDNLQKSKLKWAVEGDENSKFFHGIINKRRSQLAIRGIFVEGCVYKVVTKILANRLALVISDLVSDTQSAFIAGRQILDGPFILDEILKWCKRKKNKAMFFKVDFAKAYDSVRWDYLIDVLEAFGFGSTWYSIDGIRFSISHLFYAGCALFIGVWWRYLGVKVGESMSRHKAWDDIIHKLTSRLSNWKAKTLSIGGRLTLLKSVLGASPIYSMSIYKVPKGVLKIMEAIRDGEFRVKEVRNFIDDLFLPSFDATRWVKYGGIFPRTLGRLSWSGKCWFNSVRLASKVNKARDLRVLQSVTVVAGNTQEENVPHVVDLTVEKDKLSSLEDTTVLGSFPPLPTQVITSVGNSPGKSSYANVTGKPRGKKVIVRTLFTPGGNGIDVVVLVDSIHAISERFANTAYGFFLGKKISSTGLFSFQFSSIDGLDVMLENGSRFIRNNPLILKKWHPGENLLKEDVSTVPVWVKLHGVSVTAFSEDGLSAIATKLGTPLMLDSYTFDMCMQSWGRSSYARVMIELRADVELKDNIVVAMPKITREGHYTCNVRVEYEWKPPRCSSCKVFGHIHDECPKNTGVGEKKIVKKRSQTSQGVLKGVEPTIEVSNSNSFVVLNSINNDWEFGTNSSNTPIVPTGIVESDSEVEVVFDETANLRISTSDNDDYDPYDDDMYENHDMSEHIQSICDGLYITVRDRKKK